MKVVVTSVVAGSPRSVVDLKAMQVSALFAAVILCANPVYAAGISQLRLNSEGHNLKAVCPPENGCTVELTCGDKGPLWKCTGGTLDTVTDGGSRSLGKFWDLAQDRVVVVAARSILGGPDGARATMMRDPQFKEWIADLESRGEENSRLQFVAFPGGDMSSFEEIACVAPVRNPYNENLIRPSTVMVVVHKSGDKVREFRNPCFNVSASESTLFVDLDNETIHGRKDVQRLVMNLVGASRRLAEVAGRMTSKRPAVGSCKGEGDATAMVEYVFNPAVEPSDSDAADKSVISDPFVVKQCLQAMSVFGDSRDPDDLYADVTVAVVDMKSRSRSLADGSYAMSIADLRALVSGNQNWNGGAADKLKKFPWKTARTVSLVVGGLAILGAIGVSIATNDASRDFSASRDRTLKKELYSKIGTYKAATAAMLAVGTVGVVAGAAFWIVDATQKHPVAVEVRPGEDAGAYVGLKWHF